MKRRSLSSGILGHPLGQLLAMFVMGVVLIAAILMGAFVLMALLGLFVIGYLVIATRVWWRTRMTRGRARTGRDAKRGPANGIRYIEGEYEVIKAEADDARRRIR